ncbi:DUF805 domain-containing protein [Angustibacter sp. McL0619]|uniref:DUF805 domain-containing protein n=1 Tax=Angustibacter sp. McL0619 TaxID=3415676 RepID=UPI003CF9ED0B
MSFTEAVKTCLSKYSDFSGRARRSEYWFFSLAFLLAYLVLVLLGLALGRIFYILVAFVVLGFIIPSLAVTWRRLHDTGRSGAWYFIAFVPVVGGIILLVFTVLDSQPGPNVYGPNPKEGPTAVTA